MAVPSVAGATKADPLLEAKAASFNPGGFGGAPVPIADAGFLAPGKAATYPMTIDMGDDWPGPVGVEGGCLPGYHPCYGISVTLEITHHYMSDVAALLVSPLGDKIVLVSRACGSADSHATWLFDDDATLLPATDGPACHQVDPYLKVHTSNLGDDPLFPPPAPPGPYPNTSMKDTFAGKFPNGVWKLYMIDQAQGATGSLDSSVLVIHTKPDKCLFDRATSAGDNKDNLVIGTRLQDSELGFRGDDTIRGRGQGDKLCGSFDDDRLFGGPGPDKLLGGRGADILKGGRGHDILMGGPGHDVVRPSPGNDVIKLGAQ